MAQQNSRFEREYDWNAEAAGPYYRPDPDQQGEYQEPSYGPQDLIYGKPSSPGGAHGRHRGRPDKFEEPMMWGEEPTPQRPGHGPDELASGRQRRRQAAPSGYAPPREYRRQASRRTQDLQPRFQEDYSGRGPKGYQRSDERILDEVADRLTQDPRIDASTMTVSVENGVVSLEGDVDSRRIKKLTEDVVDMARGVKDVSNDLQIEGLHD
jgi:hypothetical protein